MTEEEKKIADEAVRYVKTHKRDLITKFSDGVLLMHDQQPVSIFMAGSPGAGKTEVSKRLVARFSQHPIRIDADEIRALCPGYTGGNAHLFQSAATKGVHILHEYALQQKLNIILDGTFAYHDALDNVRRSLTRNRKVEIVYVYQPPVVAWDFTKKREALESRRVSKETFINAYFTSHDNVNAAKKTFGDQIELTVFVKNFGENTEDFAFNAPHLESVIKQWYTRDALERILL